MSKNKRHILLVSALAYAVIVNTAFAETNVVSSLRYKHDITPLRSHNTTNEQDLLSKILQINPTYFVYNEDQNLGTERQIGVIAEELTPLFPELVAFDQESRPDSVNYAQMSALLVHAIQELNTKDLAQQAQIDAQKQEIADLKKTLVTVFDRLDKYEKLDAILNKIDVDTLAELYDDLDSSSEEEDAE